MVTRLKSKYGFPQTISTEDIGRGTDEQASKYAHQMADVLKQIGINFNFAPVLDVNVNPENPVIGALGRSFSSNPEKVAHYASIFSQAYKEKGILCTYKHFSGHGSSTNDTHDGFVDVTKTWKAYELVPYKTLIRQSESCPVIMTAHVTNTRLDSKGLPCTLSYEMITKLLREELHFNGVVVTDDMQMKAIADQYGSADAIKLSINAGADILLFGNRMVSVRQDPKQLIDIIYDSIQSGEISETRINEAYQRIMKLKAQLRAGYDHESIVASGVTKFHEVNYSKKGY